MPSLVATVHSWHTYAPAVLLPTVHVPHRGWRCLLLQEYAANPATNWKSKDAAVYLVLAVTVKGRTGERGATTTNPLVKVEDFMNTQVGAPAPPSPPLPSCSQPCHMQSM